MKRLVAPVLALQLAAAPVAAGEGAEKMGEGIDLLRQGTELVLRGLLDELGPALLELQGQIIDLSQYELPEVLPNGDILIRRKPAPPSSPPAEEGEVDL